MTTLTVTYHQDPGHGWLEVPMTDIQAAGIADQISRYSYRAGPVAYLEEDCDASLFVQACKRRGIEVQPVEVYTNRDSFIRRLQRFGS